MGEEAWSRGVRRDSGRGVGRGTGGREGDGVTKAEVWGQGGNVGPFRN